MSENYYAIEKMIDTLEGISESLELLCELAIEEKKAKDTKPTFKIGADMSDDGYQDDDAISKIFGGK